MLAGVKGLAPDGIHRDAIAGISETGVASLRFEIDKEIAPFVGVSFEQFKGNTARLIAADGEATSSLRALVGLQIWF